MKHIKSLGKVQATIIVVSLLAFFLVVYSNWVTLNILDHADRWDPLPENVQFAATLAHLSLGRAAEGDDQIQLHKDIQGPLDQALGLCRDQLRARRRTLGIFKPVDDSEVKATVSALAKELESLRDLMAQSFTQRAAGQADSRLEQACQKRFKEVIQLSQASRKSLVKVIGQERMVISAIHTGNLVVLFGLFAGLVEFVLRQYRLNRDMRIKQECQMALRADVGLALAAGEDLDGILQRCAQSAIGHFNGAFAGVWLLNGEENVLELRSIAGVSTRIDRSHSRIPVGTPLVGVIAKEQRPYCTHDLAQVPEAPDKPWIAREGMVAFAGIPLRVENRLVGVLGLYARQRLPGYVLELMESVGDLIAQGIVRKGAEQKISEQAALLEKAKDAIIVTDLANLTVYWNKSAERLYGFTAEEALDQKVDQLLYQKASEFEAAKLEVMEKGEWRGECLHRTKADRMVTVDSHWSLVHDDHGTPKSILIVNTDITEKKKFEAQFLRTQRIESIGTLAGGIAHDLNNTLAPVVMSVELLKQKLLDEQSTRMLSILESSASRAAHMVKQILAFARGTDGERTLLQPQRLIREIAKIVTETFPKSMTARTKVAENLWSLMGDPTQLHQILMNLAVNARDAMPNGGFLSFSAENAVVGQDQDQMHGDIAPGCYVLITVADTGTGIPREILDKIFDPFFTTKQQGKGTGLGLSTVMGIVKGHGGFLQVHSEINKGTQFKVYLPALANVQEQQNDGESQRLPKGQGQVLLLVDDEPTFLSMTKELLENFGYKVLTAADGTEAIAVYSTHRGQIKAVFTDMLMPHMDGAATIRVLKKLDPTLRIVATSGLMDSDRVKEATGNEDVDFLTKPFTAERLLNTVQNLLHS